MSNMHAFNVPLKDIRIEDVSLDVPVKHALYYV